MIENKPIYFPIASMHVSIDAMSNNKTTTTLTSQKFTLPIKYFPTQPSHLRT